MVRESNSRDLRASVGEIDAYGRARAASGGGRRGGT